MNKAPEDSPTDDRTTGCSKEELEKLVELRVAELSSANEQLKIEIAECKRVEFNLNNSRQQLMDIIDFLPDATFVIDSDNKVISWNKAIEEMSGVRKEAMVGQGDYAYAEPFYGERRPFLLNLLDVSEADLAKKYQLVQRQGATLCAEAFVPALFGGRGAHVWAIAAPLYDTEGKRSGAIESIRDISMRKLAEEEKMRLEQQFWQAQKLESLGVLASGIAHDFNNILTAIIGNADLAIMRINKESPAIENLHSIGKAAARAADLAKQMLAYSGKGKSFVANLDLSGLLEEMRHLLVVSVSSNVVIRLNLHTPLPAVEADTEQIRQVIMNLVINASEAIGDNDGAIDISTGCIDCDRNYLKDLFIDENLAEGRYVLLEITDNGCGMERETLAKLFDPFFTTKFTGRGLGMAAVLGIVRGHKGAIKVYSEPLKGTTFKILLPVGGSVA